MSWRAPASPSCVVTESWTAGTLSCSFSKCSSDDSSWLVTVERSSSYRGTAATTPSFTSTSPTPSKIGAVASPPSILSGLMQESGAGHNKYSKHQQCGAVGRGHREMSHGLFTYDKDEYTLLIILPYYYSYYLYYCTVVSH